MRTKVLFIIVLSQFACVSLWFAGNGIIEDLIREFGLNPKSVGHITSVVQFGFITGTLIFAALAIADRFSPSKVFLCCAIIAALCNATLVLSEGNLAIIYPSRFLTGFFLAGIYPVGMKIAADYFSTDLSKALGYLLGALVFGTAFPHFLHYIQAGWSWYFVVISTSVLAVIGGCLVYFFIPDGPFRVKRTMFKLKGLFHVFNNTNFRSAAFGYFGHMWEVYAFWTFVPLIVNHFKIVGTGPENESSFQSFLVIGIGGLACIGGGYVARWIGSYKVAFIALCASGICCLISPVIFLYYPVLIFAFLLLWGTVVIMDSPQFSTLIAGSAPQEYKGSALTLVNCIGFSITILSIQVLTALMEQIPFAYLFLILLPGPVFGVLSMHHARK